MARDVSRKSSRAVQNVVLKRIQADLAERDAFEDDKIEIYREMYWRELDLRNELSRTVTFLSVIVSIVFGAGAFVIETKISGLERVISAPDLFVGCTIFLTYVFGVVSVVFIIRTTHGRTYEFVPSPFEIEKYSHESRKYFEFVAPKRVNARVREDFKRLLNAYFVNCTDSNRKNNIVRAAYRFRAYRFAVLSIVFLIASFIGLAVSEAIELISASDVCVAWLSDGCTDE